MPSDGGCSLNLNVTARHKQLFSAAEFFDDDAAGDDSDSDRQRGRCRASEGGRGPEGEDEFWHRKEKEGKAQLDAEAEGEEQEQAAPATAGRTRKTMRPTQIPRFAIQSQFFLDKTVDLTT